MTNIRYNKTTDLVYSPDDGGWYAIEFSILRQKTRVTEGIYESEILLKNSLDIGAVAWEEWN